MESLEQTIKNTAIIGGLCILVSIILITIIAKKVIKSLNVIDKKICDIVNDHGDLTQTIQIKAKDETKKIASHVNELLKYMREIMTTLQFMFETI